MAAAEQVKPRVVGTLLVVVLLSLGFLEACGDAAHTPQLGETERRALYERVDRIFAAGVLLKPAPGAIEGIEFDLAPLLLVQTDTQTTANVDTPVVHLQSGSVEIGGATYEQLTFVWWYPTASAEDRRGQGLRATLSGDGFPALYEVWGDASGARSIFVSSLLEASASAEFGAPLEERKYSIERSVDEAPAVVVPGILEPGPIPLGPFVYLTQTDHDVATLICRCSASQVERIVDSPNYELRRSSADDPEAPSWLHADEATALDRVLRLPSSGL